MVRITLAARSTPSTTFDSSEAKQDGSSFRISHSFVAGKTGAYRLTLPNADHTPSINYTATILV